MTPKKLKTKNNSLYTKGVREIAHPKKLERNELIKKIFAILMTICLMAGALSITAFAAEETSAIKVTIGSATKTFDSFEDGWNYANIIVRDD